MLGIIFKTRKRPAVSLRNRCARNSHGFTLIELLVVIAIISLLVSILLPSLQKAKDLAKQVTCMSNLRNWGVAHMLYVQENDETFVYGSISGGGDMLTWFMPGLYYYIGSKVPIKEAPPEAQSIYLCPSDPAPYTYPGTRYADYPDEPTNRLVTPYLSYGANHIICRIPYFGYDYGKIGNWCRISDLTEPSETFLMVDANYPHVYNFDCIKRNHFEGSRNNIAHTDGSVSVYEGMLPEGPIQENLPGFRWAL